MVCLPTPNMCGEVMPSGETVSPFIFVQESEGFFQLTSTFDLPSGTLYEADSTLGHSQTGEKRVWENLKFYSRIFIIFEIEAA